MAEAETIDVNTDNLDDFETLFSGKATATPEPEAEVVEDTEAPEAEVADDTSADDVPDDEETTETEDDESEEEVEDIFKPKKKNKVQERIDELTRNFREEQRAKEALVAELAEVKRLQVKEVPQKAAVVEGAPHPDDVDAKGDFIYPDGRADPQYIADLTQFQVEMANNKFQERLKQEAEAAKAEAVQQQKTAEWEGKIAKTEKEYPDLRVAFSNLRGSLDSLEPSYGTYLADTIMGMDAGPEVLYYLGKNLDEADDIVAAGPARATLMLGKLEARIQAALAKKAAPTVRPTKAPEPAKTTRGTGPRLSTADDTDDLDAFAAKFYGKKN